MKVISLSCIVAAGCLLAQAAVAAPTATSTVVIGTIAGPGADLHDANTAPRPIEFYGTDLGLTYTHGNKIHFLFGDSWRTEAALPIEPPNGLHDDAFGTVDLAVYNSPKDFKSTEMPRVKLAQAAGSVNALGLNPDHVMDLAKTPLGGFSNGSREFAMFTTVKPLACANDSECTNVSTGLTCDISLGFFGEKPDKEAGFTGGCTDDQLLCTRETKFDSLNRGIANTGFCRDKTSTSYGSSTPAGRVSAVAMKLRIGVRSTSDPSRYTNAKTVLTAKFLNSTLATVQSFVPASGSSGQDYQTAGASGANRRVFLWGRSAFIGVNKLNRTAGLYFAYVNMPTSETFTWNVNYFTGMSGSVPQFSTDQSKAVPLDLDSTLANSQPKETYDVVNQMSVMWVQKLNKWVMFYGGGMSTLKKPFLSCGVLEVFAGPDCGQVTVGNGAIRMRTADNPWGPWTPPQDVILGGVPGATPLQGQYRPGGVLRHPRCTVPNCAEHSDTDAYLEGEYGFLYGANLIQAWVDTEVGTGVDVIWNASTWDPYRVVLLRTRIVP